MAYLTRNLIHTITYAAPSGVDQYGDPTSNGTLNTAAAYIISRAELFRLFDRTEFQVTDALITEAPITKTTRVWLPGANTADVGEARIPQSVDVATAFWDSNKTLYLVLF